MGTAARFLSQGLEPHHACRTAADARADARTGAADRRAAARDRRETRRSAARLGKLNRRQQKTPGAGAPGVCNCAAWRQCRAGRARGAQPFGSNGEVTLSAFVSEAESPFGLVTTMRGAPAGSGGSVSVIVCASTTTDPLAIAPSNVTTAPVTKPEPLMVVCPPPSVVAQIGATRMTARPGATIFNDGPTAAVFPAALMTLTG